MSLQEIEKGVQDFTRKMDLEELYEYLIKCEEDVKNLDYEIEYVPEVENKVDEYKLSISSASCNVNDIKNIIFGAAHSRFWMYRKHMNSINLLKYREDKNIPFFSWQCLTLQLENRDLNLVIKDEVDMTRILKFLIY